MNPNVNMGGDSRGRRSEGGQTQDRQWRIETWLEPPPQSPSLRPIFEARSSSHQFGSITAAIGFRDALLHHPDIPTIPPVDRHMLMPESQASNTELTSQALLQHPEPPQSTHHPIPGTNRRWQPEDSLWEKHKEIIKDLYITKRQTLKDTMAYMEKHHSFRASKKMYNERFKPWGFHKNLTKRQAKKISSEQRQRAGKPSVTRVGNSIMDEARVARSIRRFKAVSKDIPTPPEAIDIQVATPLAPTSKKSPAEEPESCSKSATMKLESGWTPSYATPFNEYPQDTVLRSDWRNMSHDDLYQLKADAATAFSIGRVQEAEYKLRDAIAGIRNLFGLNHSATTNTAYQLASVYAKLSRMEDAVEVLDWSTKTLVDELSLEHPTTINHLMNVVELLYTWSKDDDAVAIVSSLFDPIQTLTEYDSSRLRDVTDTEIAEKTTDGNVNPYTTTEAIRDGMVNLELDITADIQHHPHAPSTEQLLTRLVGQCEKHPEQLAISAVKARVMLLEHHERHHRLEDAFTEAKAAALAVTKLVSEQENNPSLDLLDLSQQLAFFGLRNYCSDSCERMLGWVAEQLERGMSKGSTCSGHRKAAAIDYMVQAARRYLIRDEDDWENISIWLERAYGLSVRLLGSTSDLSSELENALKTHGQSMLQKHPGTGVSIGSRVFAVTVPKVVYGCGLYDIELARKRL